MERFTISKFEKQTIYEIYRACRLCGAGGGYRMPIIQNIIDVDSPELELRQKIQECLQLEVRPDDRMPPLICELCVDKVNEFHQFLELTRQTNIKTRTRLGLPIQDTKKGEPEQSNCILGVTEPVYTKENEPAKKSKAGPKSSKIKKEPDVVNVKVENVSDSSRSSSVSSRSSRPAPSPAPAPALAPAPAPRSRRSLRDDTIVPPVTRKPETTNAREAKKADTPKSKEGKKETPKSKEIKKNETPKDAQTPKEKKAPPAKKKGELESLLEDSMKFDDNSLLLPRTLKRTREEPPKPALLPKRAKPVPTKELLKDPSPPRRPGPKSRQPVKEPTPPPRPGPKSKKARVEEENIPVPLKVPKSKAKPESIKAKEPSKPPEEPLPAPPSYKCIVCENQCKNSGAFARHMTVHVPTFTKLTNACNPCGQWFVTAEEAASHHRFHSASTFPYHCRRCFDDFRTLRLYDEHIESGLCVGDDPPSVKCEDCLALFATEALRTGHKCPGRTQGARPGGKCSKCSRTYATAKTLKKHESQCTQKSKGGDLIADPDVLRRLKPMQVRITKCDGLLVREIGDHYDVSRVKPNYGLAKNYIYPYMKLPPVKSEPLYRNSMVAIPLALKEELSFTHWDSDSDVEETIIKTVPSLTTLTIKKLFSKNLLGKVPRKRKKVKNETFDNEEFGDVSKDINDIINSLDDRGNGRLDSNLTARIKDIIGCLDDDVGESVDTANEQSELDVNDKTIDNDNIGEKDKTISKSEDQPDTPNDIEADKTVADENQAEDEAVTNEYCNKTDIDNNKNDESTKGDEMESNSNAEKSSTDVNVGENNINNVLESNQINDVVNESEIINRVDSGTNDHSDNFNKEDISLQKSKEDENIALDSMDLDNVAINGINTHSNGNSFDNDSKLNEDESCPGKDSKNNDDDTILSNDNSFDNGSKLNEDESCPGKDSKNNDDDTRLSNDNSFDNGSKLNENDTSLESDSKIIDDSRKISNDKSFDNDSKLKENECSPEKDSKVNDDGTRLLNDNSFDIHSKLNETESSLEKDSIMNDEMNKTEEANKQINKESPIKHSIENLIGESDKSADKYISEVMSNIEELNRCQGQINGQNILEENIGEKRLSDQDKITLEDLLPKENKCEELENISDDDFNFDT